MMGIKVLICVIKFFEFIFDFLDFWVSIIFFNLFINVGINFRVIDIIIFNWCIGILIILRGVNNFLKVFVKLIGLVESVMIVVIIIIKINFSDI